MSEVKSQVKSESKVNKKLSMLWAAYYDEANKYKNKTLGKVLTIIDATITDEKQNKSVKDLITKVFWEDEYYLFRMASWFNWFNDTVEIKPGNGDQSQPFPVEEGVVVPFLNFKK